MNANSANAFTNHPIPINKPIHLQNIRKISASNVIPKPSARPDFTKPDTNRLLAFGQTPIPKQRPTTDSKGILGRDNTILYRKIFAYQEMGQWDRADELISQLTDMSLRGHVFYQRFMHPTAYRASFDDLRGWLELYADHPNASKVYELALKRKPDDYKGRIKKPINAGRIGGVLQELDDYGDTYKSPRRRTSGQKRLINVLQKQIRRDLINGSPTKALNRLKEDYAATLLDDAEYDRFLAQIASSYMYHNKLDEALELAVSGTRRSGEKSPVSGWVGGLVAWRQGNYALAAPLFERTAISKYASRWTASAGSYWAARSHKKLGRHSEYKRWMNEAAKHPRTFYGLIAAKTINKRDNYNWHIPALTEEHKKILSEIPAGRRAEALTAIGQFHLAEQELRRINPGKDKNVREALLAYVQAMDLAALSMRMAEAYASPDGRLYDAALYPISPWHPQGGYKVDRALINAFIRQESRFDPQAESHSGASGLMQLMPSTASYVAGSKIYKTRHGRHNLKNPQINLDIGQRYIQNLLNEYPVEGDLFSLVTAYNAGPGNLRRWKREHADILDDPLLFIETIPMAETRAFVERVMANYWIYRIRLDQPTPSLNAVADGYSPQYVSLDRSPDTIKKYASNETSSQNYRMAQTNQ